MGYDTKLVSTTMIPEVYALIDGGTWDAEKKSYEAPVIGEPIDKKLFTTYIYTEVKDANGETTGYVEFTYLHCKGTPISFTLADGEFYVPEMNIKSRPKMKESPVSWKIVDEMPKPVEEGEPSGDNLKTGAGGTKAAEKVDEKDKK